MPRRSSRVRRGRPTDADANSDSVRRPRLAADAPGGDKGGSIGREPAQTIWPGEPDRRRSVPRDLASRVVADRAGRGAGGVMRRSGPGPGLSASMRSRWRRWGSPSRLTHATWPLLRPTPWALFFAAVMASAWFGGLGPSLVATAAAAALGGDYFIPPYRGVSLAPDALIPVATFVAVSVFIGVLASARRRAEAFERAGRRRFQATMSSIGDAVIATDALGRVSFMNGVAEELTGWGAAEAVGRRLDEVFVVVSEETRAPVDSPFAKVLETGRARGLTSHAVLIRRDGTERAIDDSSAPVRDDGGRLAGAVIVFRDIARRRRAERALRESEARHRFLAELAAATQPLTDPADVMANTARLLAEHLGADRCAYAEVEDRGHLRHQRRPRPRGAEPRRPLAGRLVRGRVRPPHARGPALRRRRHRRRPEDRPGRPPRLPGRHHPRRRLRPPAQARRVHRRPGRPPGDAPALDPRRGRTRVDRRGPMLGGDRAGPRLPVAPREGRAPQAAGREHQGLRRHPPRPPGHVPRVAGGRRADHRLLPGARPSAGRPASSSPPRTGRRGDPRPRWRRPPATAAPRTGDGTSGRTAPGSSPTA